MKKITLLFIFCLAFVGLAFKGCPGKNGGPEKSDWWTGYYTAKNSKKTPLGVTVYSYETVTDANLQNVDAGLERVFDIAGRVYSYQNGLNYSEYQIVLFKRSQLCTGAAGFAVRADNYDGSEYDKDPRPGFGAVCAAGLSSSFEPPFAVIVQDDPTIALATRFEGEHLILYQNDRQKWQDTLTHSNGQGHPILPDTDGSAMPERSLTDAGITPVTFNNSEISLLENPDLKIKKGTEICLFLVK